MRDLFIKINVAGTVQGVGFRPFVWELANRFNYLGWVLNNGEGVSIYLSASQSSHSSFDDFIQCISNEAPPLSQVDSIQESSLDKKDLSHLKQVTHFSIIQTQHSTMQTSVLADAATCADCLAEINDSSNRRYGYAFTNCTHCGPRYSIIKSMPYDRVSTSMSDFTMCEVCLNEYESPANRRFHAQPNACPDCGPALKIAINNPGYTDNDTDNDTHPWRFLALEGSSTIQKAVFLLKEGKILAVKGIGGIHLICDATNQDVCEQLRARKNRPFKPFALMADSIASLTPYVELSSEAKNWLSSVQAPIVLMQKKESSKGEFLLCKAIAPAQNRLGFMLPSNPIHHLLLSAWQSVSKHGVLVFTSANQSGLPQIYKDEVALNELSPLADAYLTHNRQIIRRLEDSVVSIYPCLDSSLILRQARGFSPFSLNLPEGFSKGKNWIASGADLKNSIAIRKNTQIVMSQYIGDLENYQIQETYQQTWHDMQTLYQFVPNKIIHDSHSGYHSSKISKDMPLKKSEVQHHHAHFNACLLENGSPKDMPPVLGIILDGLGYGEDHTFWGGEFLYGQYSQVKRVAHLTSVPLFGGDKANKEPWRSTFSQLRNCNLDAHQNLSVIQKINQKPIQLLEQAFEKNINCPLTSSAGRLFDAVAAMCDICFEKISYEGQAAMELEALLDKNLINQQLNNGYRLEIDLSNGMYQLNPTLLFNAILNDLQEDINIKIISARFHIGFAKSLIDMVLVLQKNMVFTTLLLSGGVCQNGWLVYLIKYFIPTNITLLTHHILPANDQAIAVGQLLD